MHENGSIAIQVRKPRPNRVNRCPPFQIPRFCGSDIRHQGGLAYLSAPAPHEFPAFLEFLCHFAIADSYALGPKSAATARTFNTCLPSCDRRFVINHRKLMIVDCQQQAVIDSLVKVTACAIALCRGEKAFDNPQPIKECRSSSSCARVRFKPFCKLPQMRYQVF